MGLKDFLKKQGFIVDDSAKKTDGVNTNQDTGTSVVPTFFPPQTDSVTSNSNEPAFVAPLQQNPVNHLDPAFIKFFEDELVKANLPGPDYFEFRQLLNKTQQKMSAKGMASPEVVLQTVLMSFEAQDVPRAKLIEAAQRYKNILKEKNDDFLRGADAEKNNQLQKRQSALQAREANMQKIQQQLLLLEQQKRQLEDALEKERTQADVDKTMGKEGIIKIERAQQLITQAHNYIQSTIDADIERLHAG